MSLGSAPAPECEAREVVLAAVRRHHQCAGAGRRGVVDVRPGADEPPAGFDVTVASREQQRRVPAPVPDDALVVLRSIGGLGVHHPGTDAGTGADVRTVDQKDVDDLVVALRDRPHERGLAARPFLRVDVGAVRRELPDRVRAAGARGGHDRGLAVEQRDVRIGARVEQPRDHGGAAVAGGQPDRRGPELVGGVDVGAGVEQERGGLRIVPVGRPVQGGGAVGLGGADVDSRGDQSPDGIRVLRARRLDDCGRIDAGGGRLRTSGQEDRDCRREQRREPPAVRDTRSPACPLRLLRDRAALLRHLCSVVLVRCASSCPGRADSRPMLPQQGTIDNARRMRSNYLVSLPLHSIRKGPSVGKVWFAAGVAVVLMLPAAAVGTAFAQAAEPAAASVSPQRALLDRYCVTCHNERIVAGNGSGMIAEQLRLLGLTLDNADIDNVAEDPELWEKVVRKLRVGAMPPQPRARPDKETYDGFRRWLEDELDRAAEARPDPGRTQAFHRLNQAEYRNVVRDLLDLEIDVAALIPADAPDRNGFDNIATSLSLSPALFERYVSAAKKIGRLAIGEEPTGGAEIATYDIPLNLIQNDRQSEDLPFGSRGGAAIRHHFPVDGEYRIKVRLATNYVGYIRGIDDAHEIEFRLDGRRIERFTFGGEAPGMPAPISFAGNIRGTDDWEDYTLHADDPLEVTTSVSAGPHTIGVSFPRETWEEEGVLQPRQTGFALAINEMPDGNPALSSVQITGPLSVDGPGDTPTRRRIFTCLPESAAPAAEQEACARQILGTLARRAYRRPVDEADVATLLQFYEWGRADGGFEKGVQFALERLLADPDFLYRVERDPVDMPGGATYPVSDVELASRLSFFLWSSIPDDELLAAAEKRDAERSRGARCTGPAHAGGPALAGDGRQLRRPVALPAQHGRRLPRPEHLSGVRREPARGVHARDGAVHPATSCGPTPACSSCCRPTTPTSTSGSPSTTASRTSTGTGSGGCSSTAPGGAVSWATAA